MSLDVYLIQDGGEVFSANITHNLAVMAKAAGLYIYLWRPEEVPVVKASDLLKPLLDGLAKLVVDKTEMTKYTPENGWGTWENLFKFVTEYLQACASFPDAKVEISR